MICLLQLVAQIALHRSLKSYKELSYVELYQGRTIRPIANRDKKTYKTLATSGKFTGTIPTILLCWLTGTFSDKLVNGLDHGVFVKVVGKDTIAQLSLEKNQSQLSICYLLVHTH